MADEAKIIVVKTDTATPPNIDVSLVDLRDVVLNNPEILVDALRDALQGAGGRAQLTGGDLPLDTPIAKMVDPSVAELLTANARRLTKADILALGGFTQPGKSATDLGLSVDDVRSLEIAFHQDFQGILTTGGAGLEELMGSTNDMTAGTDAMAIDIGDIKCCCCPCCCCTAAVELTPIEAIA